MRKRYDVDEIKGLARIIDVIARKCWRGLPALMGLEPKPSREQLKQALFYRPSSDVDSSIKNRQHGNGEGREIALEDAMIDEVDSILDLIQWNEIVSCVKRYAQEYPRSWAIYREFTIAQEQTRSSWGGIGALSKTAEKFNTTDYNIRETAKSVPLEIARSVSMGYGRDEFFLHTK